MLPLPTEHVWAPCPHRRRSCRKSKYHLTSPPSPPSLSFPFRANADRLKSRRWCRSTPTSLAYPSSSTARYGCPPRVPPPRLTGTKGSSNLHPGVVDDGAAGSSPLLFMSLDASYVDSVVVAVAGTAVVELARRANSLRRVGSSEAPDEVVASALCRRMKHDGVIFGVLAAAPLLFLLARKGGSGAATTSLENPSSILRCSRKSLQDESSLRVDWRANNSCVW